MAGAWQPQWVVRTVRNGRVKILGRWFYPNKQFTKYDGRLDGSRWRFGLYWEQGRQMDMVGLHSEEGASSWPGRDCIDGKFPWYWWYTEDKGRKHVRG